MVEEKPIPSSKSSMAKNLIETREMSAAAAEEEEEEEQQMEDWDDWKTDEDDSDPDFLCLFCDLKWGSMDPLIDHCRSEHSFDFQAIRNNLQLDFYGSFKLINYVRSQVAANKCWNCGSTFQSNKDLQNHLHAAFNFGKNGKLPWQDDMYLKPFMPEDALLHSFGDDEDGEDDYTASVDREELLRELANSKDLGEICIDDEDILDTVPSELVAPNENRSKEASCVMNGSLNLTHSLEKVAMNRMASGEDLGSPSKKQKDKNLRVSFANVAAKEIKNVNESYFGAYGSFGIHKEMISDKVRTDTYRDAILSNPSLMNHATVMDVGCGTGILRTSELCINGTDCEDWQAQKSVQFTHQAGHMFMFLHSVGSLFAARAGASRVIAVEASEKMAAVATQIAKDNGLLQSGNQDREKRDGVITVVQCMVEELNKSIQVPPNSVDVLMSEWMGYCLLYESMLSSVLYARDRWLKPGGAILPDYATIFVAGFGKGGTSFPFWENVYGFDMSCIGKEVVEDAAQLPIVDVIDSRDIVTNTVVLQTFDLVTMKPDDMDFTTNIELELKSDLHRDSKDAKSETTSCYGFVLWFETAFSSRFCKEMPTTLSTSPYCPKTHWSQTIVTFREPVVMGPVKLAADVGAAIGTDACPAARIGARISIARSARHRSIDISLETTGISFDGRKRSFPVQIFNL